jgi:hypothetical protein
MEQGERARQDGAERGSPVRSSDGEVATGGDAKEVISVGWAPVIGNVCADLSELEGRRGMRMSTQPRRRNARGVSSPWRGKSVVTSAREAVRSSRGVDQRPRGRGCSWCAANGERRRGKWGAAASGNA